MKRFAFLQFRSMMLATILAPALLSAQTEESRAVGDFTGIRASQAFKIQVSQDMSCGVKVSAEDAEDLPHVKTMVENNFLVISSEGRIKNDVTVKVSVKNLNSVILSGATEIGTLNQLAVENLFVDLSGASEAKLDIQGGKVVAVATGASEITLSGKGRMLDATISGASELKSYNFETDTTKVSASGASEARVNAKALDASASGSSEVHYNGSPAILRSESSGSSEIRSRNASSDTTSHASGDSDHKKMHVGGGDYKFWNGIDLHVDGYLNSKNSIDLPDSYRFLQQDYSKSVGFSLNVLQKNIPIVKPYVKLYTGLGFSWYSYSFRNNITLLTDTNFIAATFDTINYRRDKLKTTFVNVPLMLEFNTNGKDEDQSFHIAGGLTFGYNIFDNRLKQRFGEGGDNRKRTIRDDFNVNPVRLDMSVRMGYGDFSVFGNYSLTSMFNKGEGPALYPFSAGVSFSLD